MTDNKEVMHQALDALENLELDGDYAEGFWAKRNEAIDALRGAIAQPKPRGTDAQILKEREITTSAIVGAMAYGFQNGEYPPDDSAWLRPFWEMGRHDAKRQAAIAHPEQTGLAERIQREIDHCVMNDTRLVPNLGKMKGDLAVRAAYLEAILETTAQTEQQTPVRQPLTDDEIKKLWDKLMCGQGSGDVKDFVRDIEAAHGIAQTKDKQ